jgi:hypothetical protein
VFLEVLKTFVVELLFILVVLGEELVESAISVGREYFRSDTCHDLIAVRTRPVA